MYNVSIADKLRTKKQEQDPNYNKKVLDYIREEDPQAYARYLHEDAYGRHIGDKETYNEAVKNLPWKNGKGNGAHWELDDIVRQSGIDFAKKNYDKYDYGYTVNRMYADNNNVFDDESYYMKMTQNYLEDYNYGSRPYERAYHDARKRSKAYNTRRDRDNDGRYYE